MVDAGVIHTRLYIDREGFQTMVTSQGVDR
jgi:hypothetical protein